jgi:uracil-DNA glycosylase
MSFNFTWEDFIQKIKQDPNFQKTLKMVESDRESKNVFPPHKDVFNVFRQSMDDIKVVIIGQDPYHGNGQAHGYSFSVPTGIKPPPSLKNIYQEIKNEFGYEMDLKNGNLTPWVEQGVFLLNTSLTVIEQTPGSHSNIGWDIFTTGVIEEICRKQKNIVFLLWGAHAASLEKYIKGEHLILKSAHPSPFSVHRGFFGNNHFKDANEYLEKNGKKAINWKI